MGDEIYIQIDFEQLRRNAARQRGMAITDADCEQTLQRCGITREGNEWRCFQAQLDGFDRSEIIAIRSA